MGMDPVDQTLLGFDDPTSIKDTEEGKSSFFRVMIGLFLLTFATSLGASIWDAKWGKQEGPVSSYLFSPGEKYKTSRWDWMPYRLEYQLYYDRGYNLQWLESKAANKCREYLGTLFSVFEVVAMRLWGAINYFFLMVIVFLFSVSIGSVRYFNKRFQFKHISSTFNNASIKVLFGAMPLTILWALVPFGVSIPLLGEIPIIADVPLWGAFWVSSPGFGALLFGLLFCGVGYVLGANFSREI